MRKIYLFLTMLTLSIMSYAANFSVAPTRFELDINKTATNEVYVINNTSKPLRIETYFEEDKEFGEKYNLNSNIAVFPKTVAIKPGAKQVVRFRVKPGKDLEDGEHKSYIVFREVPPEIKTEGEKRNNGNSTTNISILTELGISIYGHIGEENLKGNLENVKVSYKNKVLTLLGTAVSEGNTSLKFRYIIEDNKGEVLTKGSLGNSGRKGKKDIGVSLVSLPDLSGKEITVKIHDQKDKFYYNKKIKL